MESQWSLQLSDLLESLRLEFTHAQKTFPESAFCFNSEQPCKQLVSKCSNFFGPFGRN